MPPEQFEEYKVLKEQKRYEEAQSMLDSQV